MRCPTGPNTLNVSNHPTSRTHLYAVRHILQYVTPAGIRMWYTMRRKGKLTWQQNADIVVRRATGTDARTVQTGFTSTGTTRSTANGAVHRATVTDARMARTGFTDTALAATSASGAVRRPTARAAPTLPRAAMRSESMSTQDLLTQQRER